jgi:hypothetical protein
MTTIAIRAAGPDDAAMIVRLIRELAVFENLLEEVRITEADVLRDGFGARPCFECLLAEADGEAVGFAIHRRTIPPSRVAQVCSSRICSSPSRPADSASGAC